MHYDFCRDLAFVPPCWTLGLHCTVGLQRTVPDVGKWFFPSTRWLYGILQCPVHKYFQSWEVGHSQMERLLCFHTSTSVSSFWKLRNQGVKAFKLCKLVPGCRHSSLCGAGVGMQPTTGAGDRAVAAVALLLLAQRTWTLQGEPGCVILLQTSPNAPAAWRPLSAPDGTQGWSGEGSHSARGHRAGVCPWLLVVLKCPEGWGLAPSFGPRALRGLSCPKTWLCPQAVALPRPTGAVLSCCFSWNPALRSNLSPN